MAIVIALAFGLAALAHMAPFPFLLEAFRPDRSLWRMPRSSGAPTVYLTFDDGPNPDWTPALLDALRDAGARATFFLIDQHVTAETAPIVKRIAELHGGRAMAESAGAGRGSAFSIILPLGRPAATA